MVDDLDILCVAPAYPWPPTDGYRTRLDQMVRGLAAVGTVHHVAIEPLPFPDEEAVSPPSPAIRVTRVPLDPDRTPREWFREWSRSDLPRQALTERFASAAATSPDWATASADGAHRVPDLVYVSNLDVWIALRDLLPDAPTIVDFDNLQDVLLRSRRGRRPSGADRAGSAARARGFGEWAMARALDVVDERRWRAWQLRCADEVAAVTVCSELDVVRSGCANAVAIPNGYELLWQPPTVAQRKLSATPTVLFVGLMSYEPNADGARWFATEVFPRLRRQMPSLRFRIVGRGSENLADLRQVPGVEVVGEVRSMQGELMRADLAVVPIRHGAGTRLKVTEALANRLPCVSTAVGAEGIDVVHGTHVLIADDADGFVRACGRLLGDPSLRSRLVTAGAALYEDRYRWETIRGRLGDLARSVLEGATAISAREA